MRWSAVWCTEKRLGIGKDGTMPWPRLPRDLARFKAVTMGKPCVIGKKTWLSIGKPLPGRNLIVLSRDPDMVSPGAGVQVARDMQHAIDLASQWGQDGVVAGGENVYQQFLPLCERIYVTMLDESYECDTFAPIVDWNEWTEVDLQEHPADEKNPVRMTFVEYARRMP